VRTFAQKQGQTQQSASFNPRRSSPAAPAASRQIHSVLHLQCAIGNQAAQRRVQANSEGLEVGSGTTATTGSGHDFSRIPVYANAPVKIHAKQKVRTSGDVHEQEADRVVDQVLRMPRAEQPGQLHSLDLTKDSQTNRAREAVASPVVDEVLASPGQPLDATARTFFERRFGHHFSDVRVHTDAAAQASAALEGALAYTTGRDLVFGAGQYQPQTMAGRWLIGHELAHVIQQRGSAPGSAVAEGALEREARDAAVRVALGGSAQVSGAQGGPAVQFLRVSQGGFGKALEEFTKAWNLPNKAIILLQQSPTFMKLAATLDQHYIWLNDPNFLNPPPPAFFEWEIGPDGRMVKPAAVAGKRPLFVLKGEPSFETYNSPGNGWGADVIALQSTDIPTFIQGIAHEATHAAAFVGGAAPNPQTLVAEIEAGIQDEIAARKSEAKILGEIPDPKVKGNISLVGSRDPREVERDVSPAFNLTYLELFFFERELRVAKAAEGLDEQEALGIRNQVDKGLPWPSVIFRKNRPAGSGQLSDYAQTWYARQMSALDWEEFMKKHSPQDPTFATEKENLIQNHVKRFFKGKVSYRP
jgi:hypothetical protein